MELLVPRESDVVANSTLQETCKGKNQTSGMNGVSDARKGYMPVESKSLWCYDCG